MSRLAIVLLACAACYSPNPENCAFTCEPSASSPCPAPLGCYGGYCRTGPLATCNLATDAIAVDAVLDWGPPTLVAELYAPGLDHCASVTASGLELYFGSMRMSANTRVWRSTRAAPSDPWGAPQLVASLVVPDQNVTLPRVSAQGDEMFLGVTAAGNFDVWRSTRASLGTPWSPPEIVAELSSPGLDLPGNLVADDRVMYMTSDRTGNYELYAATRPNRTSPWTPPMLVSELNTEGYDESPWMNADETLVLFTTDRDGPGRNIFVATRATPVTAWQAAVPIAAVNLPLTNDYCSWLAGPDTLYFTSDRDGDHHIWVSRLEPR